jgi:hypothetical protein
VPELDHGRRAALSPLLRRGAVPAQDPLRNPLLHRPVHLHFRVQVQREHAAEHQPAAAGQRHVRQHDHLLELFRRARVVPDRLLRAVPVRQAPLAGTARVEGREHDAQRLHSDCAELPVRLQVELHAPVVLRPQCRDLLLGLQLCCFVCHRLDLSCLLLGVLNRLLCSCLLRRRLFGCLFGCHFLGRRMPPG